MPLEMLMTEDILTLHFIFWAEKLLLIGMIGPLLFCYAFPPNITREFTHVLHRRGESNEGVWANLKSIYLSPRVDIFIC